VPVSIIHRDHASGTNQLDAARQTVRSLTTARERAERLLEEAQATIRDMQTKVMHERMSKDEAVNRADAENQATERAIQSAQADLTAERSARRQAEAALAVAQEDYQETERQLREILAGEHGQNPSQARRRGRPRKISSGDEATAAAPDLGLDAVTDEADEAFVAVLQSLAKNPEALCSHNTDGEQPVQPRRRGRPPKVKEPESDFVEWWVPGWKERLR
jgi:hypothetical protein